MKCINDGCERESKTVRKPGMCQRCYQRQHFGYAARVLLPAQPLREYAERVGKSLGKGRPEHNQLSLEKADELCIDVLGVHPYEVYGDLYFQESL